ncbi:hypothetical protein KIH86_27915 [Paenibacillus sp. HN-1]|uniref:hypothetical protein n=1 Tax=Paenibacillus TaxID=44249 RepID=UPI001CA7BFF0|nr:MULTISPECIES: hypothetical protein [Paenibacillus]MBY9078818.1 hypothetical protein [Paenibacillus sp. CGMCC 1.18879]MBY9088022.1 hypothetical protein [Paenibacillus sinensis]
MKNRLILIEGLPGSGKSTVAQLTAQLLAEQSIKVQLYLEGNLDHPADYDGVACYMQEEFEARKTRAPGIAEMLDTRAKRLGEDVLIPYRKLLNEEGLAIPQEALEDMMTRDLYELPFERHVRLIAENWERFGTSHLHDPAVCMFECCFIQNPITMGMVKCNRSKEEVASYIRRLEEAVKPLNPLLIYVNQENPAAAFMKAVKERPAEWSEGFISYYTNQGFGHAKECKGMEGAIQVLLERKEWELEILGLLDIETCMLDNSSYSRDACTSALQAILSGK